MEQVSAPDLAGVLLLPLTAHADPRGSLTEIFRRSRVPGAREVVQMNLSISRAGVLRGLHFHRRQADYWCVLSGRALVGLFDLREDSPTRLRKAEIVMDAEREQVGLYLPPGIAHGFLAESDVTLAYLVDEYFTGQDELGLAWDDPDVGIDWHTDAPILSDRDRSNPPLAKALAQAPRF